jgi:hypothetical protein
MSIFIETEQLKFAESIIDLIRDKEIYPYLKSNYLNIVGLRKRSKTTKNFEDLILQIMLALNDEGSKVTNIDIFDATTTPGEYYLLNYKLTNTKGCAILKEGYHKDSWSFGYHKQDKNRPALRQVKPLPIIRDNNADDKLDYDMNVEKDGLIGINFHTVTSNLVGNVLEIKQASAGCQVCAHKDNFNNIFIGNVNSYIKKGQTTFSYILKEVDNTIIDYIKSQIELTEVVTLYPQRLNVTGRWKDIGKSTKFEDISGYLSKEAFVIRRF